LSMEPMVRMCCFFCCLRLVGISDLDGLTGICHAYNRPSHPSLAIGVADFPALSQDYTLAIGHSGPTPIGDNVPGDTSGFSESKPTSCFAQCLPQSFSRTISVFLLS
jgi:hypothetical protein